MMPTATHPPPGRNFFADTRVAAAVARERRDEASGQWGISSKINRACALPVTSEEIDLAEHPASLWRNTKIATRL
jgi:hypothetical protein